MAKLGLDYDPGCLPDSVIQNDRITEISLLQFGQTAQPMVSHETTQIRGLQIRPSQWKVGYFAQLVLHRGSPSWSSAVKERSVVAPQSPPSKSSFKVPTPLRRESDCLTSNSQCPKHKAECCLQHFTRNTSVRGMTFLLCLCPLSLRQAQTAPQLTS